MVHFMCFSNGTEIYIVCSGQPLETLVNKYIVHQEIRNTVKQDTESNEKQVIDAVDGAQGHEDHARYSKDEEEDIVAFEDARFRLMMVAVEMPHETVHDIFMCKPSHEFHEEISADDKKYIQ